MNRSPQEIKPEIDWSLTVPVSDGFVITPRNTPLSTSARQDRGPITPAATPDTVPIAPGGIPLKWEHHNPFGGVNEAPFGPVVRYGTGGNFAPSDATPTRVGGSALENY